jgi:hypothetical protein
MRLLIFLSSTGLVISSLPTQLEIPSHPSVKSAPRKSSSIQSIFDWLGFPFKSDSPDVSLRVPSDQESGSNHLELLAGENSATFVRNDRGSDESVKAADVLIIDMVRDPVLDVPLVRVSLEGWPHSVYSFLLDTGSGVDFMSISEYPAWEEAVPFTADPTVVVRRDVQLHGGVVGETLRLTGHGREDPVFAFSSRIALGTPVSGSVIGQGVLGANRHSRFVQEVGDFVIVPRSAGGRGVAVDPRFGGLLIIGPTELKNFCRDFGDDIVTVNAVPNANGDWAVPGGVSVGRTVAPQEVTLLIDTSEVDVILPKKTYSEYLQELYNAGLVVERNSDSIVLKDCDSQLSLASVPSVVFRVSEGLAEIAMEVGYEEFTSRGGPNAETCIMRIKTGASSGYNDEIAILSAPFLKTAALRFSNIANSVSICPAAA